jgi:hypothetical protein
MMRSSAALQSYVHRRVETKDVWLPQVWHSGYCRVTYTSVADCLSNSQGSVPISAQHAKTWGAAISSCQQWCAACARCRFVSVSTKNRDCSWFSDCPQPNLLLRAVAGFRTLHFSAPKTRNASLRLTVKGERHAGTNFVQALLEWTFPARQPARIKQAHYVHCDLQPQPRSNATEVDDLFTCCSKHGLPSRACKFSWTPFYVILVRNPYAWLSSVHRQPYTGCHKLKNFSQWLRAPFAKFGFCKPSRVRQTPMAVWNEYVLAYRQLDGADSMLLRDEDLATEHVLLGKLAELGHALGLPPRTYSLPSKLPIVKRGNQWTRVRYRTDQQKLFNRTWLAKFSEEDFRFVNGHLDPKAMHGLFSYVGVGEPMPGQAQ